MHLFEEIRGLQLFYNARDVAMVSVRHSREMVAVNKGDVSLE